MSYIEFLNDFVMIILESGHFASNVPEFIFQHMNSVIGVQHVIVLLLQPEKHFDILWNFQDKDFEYL